MICLLSPCSDHEKGGNHAAPGPSLGWGVRLPAASPPLARGHSEQGPPAGSRPAAVCSHVPAVSLSADVGASPSDSCSRKVPRWETQGGGGVLESPQGESTGHRQPCLGVGGAHEDQRPQGADATKDLAGPTRTRGCFGGLNCGLPSGWRARSSPHLSPLPRSPGQATAKQEWPQVPGWAPSGVSKAAGGSGRAGCGQHDPPALPPCPGLT